MISFKDQRNYLEEKSMQTNERNFFSMHRNDVAHAMMMIIITIDVAKASMSSKNQKLMKLIFS